MPRLHLTLFFSDLRIPMTQALACLELLEQFVALEISWKICAGEALGFGQVLGGFLERMSKSWPAIPWFDRRPAMFSLPTWIESFGAITGSQTFLGRCSWIQNDTNVYSANRLYGLSDGATMADGT